MIEPSLKDAVPGDISMALPHRITTNILEGLEALDEVMPGINSGSTLLYAPQCCYQRFDDQKNDNENNDDVVE